MKHVRVVALDPDIAAGYCARLFAGAGADVVIVEPAVFEPAARAFGGEGKLTKILAIPALPATDEARAQSVELLRAKGIDAVIPFPTMLADLIASVEVNRNYQKSDLLQVLRILKNYEFLRPPQMELFGAGRKRK